MYEDFGCVLLICGLMINERKIKVQKQTIPEFYPCPPLL